MLFKVGTTSEIVQCLDVFPLEVVDELMVTCRRLDLVYGEDRDYLKTGGYSIVLQSIDDITTLNEIVNITTHSCEWANKLGESGYVSALYVLNNDFSVAVIMPICIANEDILNAIE